MLIKRIRFVSAMALLATLPGSFAIADISSNSSFTIESHLLLSEQEQDEKEPVTQEPPPPPDVGEPDTQTAGGTRPGDTKCPARSIPAIAFIANTAKTMLESPTFWFYIPYAPDELDSFSFVVLDEQQDSYVVNSETKPLVGTPGFIRLELPPTAEPFQIGKQYSWTFSIHCDSGDDEDRQDIDGILQRVEPTAIRSSQFQTATGEINWNYLVQNRFSFDAIHYLGNMRWEDPTNPALTESWKQLLQSPRINRGEIADDPIAPCCSLD